MISFQDDGSNQSIRRIDEIGDRVHSTFYNGLMEVFLHCRQGARWRNFGVGPLGATGKALLFMDTNGTELICVGLERSCCQSSTGSVWFSSSENVPVSGGCLEKSTHLRLGGPERGRWSWRCACWTWRWCHREKLGRLQR